MSTGYLGTGSSWYGRPRCKHDGVAQLVFSFGSSGELWGGSMLELGDERGWDLIVSAVGFGDFVKNPIIGNDKAKEQLNPDLFTWNPPACLGITWPDRGVPNLNRPWWLALAKEIKGRNGKVGVCCTGGHGRTGTMLSILVPLLGGLKKKKACPVGWVRDKYCDKAVESDEQIDYVEHITERVVRVASSDEIKPPLPLSPPASTTTGKKAVVTTVTPNPTVGLPPSQGTFELGQTDTAGGYEGSVRDEPPTDLELLWGLEYGDGEFTVPLPNGSGQHTRWRPVYDEDDEIVGWVEEGTPRADPKLSY